MLRDARVYVADALAAGDLIASFTAGRSLASYESDEMLRSAVERQFEIMGEAQSAIRNPQSKMVSDCQCPN